MSRWFDEPALEDLTKQGVVSKVYKGERRGNDSVEFEFENGKRFYLTHEQDCCETVYLEDVTGDLADLVGHPLTTASERTSEKEEDPDVWGSEHETWTFYVFECPGGSVTLRWKGTSNGYYSEGVSLLEDKGDE